MNNEGMMAIGPWGWIGWFVAAGLSMVLAKLWMGSSARSLRELQRELDNARKVIQDQKDVIGKQHRQINSIKELNKSLTDKMLAMEEKFSELVRANDRLRTGLVAVTNNLKAEKELRDRQYQELIATKGRHGEL